MHRADIRECTVLVRKLTLDEISRMTISPFFISSKCGRCYKFAHYGPKCTTCSVSYHYECALQRGMCCEFPILLNEKKSEQLCPRCLQNVNFGVYCIICSSKFHSNCLSPYDQCCNFNLCRLPPKRSCGKCHQLVEVGPRCPFCANMFHPQCVEEDFTCCGNTMTFKDHSKHKCKICCRYLSLGCIMCLFCGKMYHSRCLVGTKGNGECCSKYVPLEVYFIPSFKSVIRYFKRLASRRTQLKRLDETAQNHTYSRTLRSMIKETYIRERAKKKSISSQTSALDRIEIINVKTEVEEPEIDLSSSPAPQSLQREKSVTPEPSSSSHKNDPSMEGEDTLRNLFDFLYNMVKKFPPQLQTQVKIDLFKIVTEAEMHLQSDRD